LQRYKTKKIQICLQQINVKTAKPEAKFFEVTQMTQQRQKRSNLKLLPKTISGINVSRKIRENLKTAVKK